MSDEQLDYTKPYYHKNLCFRFYESYFVQDGDRWEFVGIILYNIAPKAKATGYPRAFGYLGREEYDLENDIYMENNQEVSAGSHVLSYLYPISRDLD